MYEDSADLPAVLYRAKDVRELDRRAIEEHGVAGIELMTRAGEACWHLVCARWPRARRIVVVCGGGNNGGDGYVVARLAHEQGREVTALAVADARDARSDAGLARDACAKAGASIQPFTSGAFGNADIIIDALLGTGLEREVAGDFRAAILAINQAPCPVVSVDVPSGLNADTGRVMGVAVRADATMCCIGLKAGLCTGQGRSCAGAIYFDDLGVSPAVYDGIVPVAKRILVADLAGLLPTRAADAHKGNFGRVLVIGGNHGMAGACALAAAAAYQAGAGHVTVATRPAHVSAIVGFCPEALVYGVEDAGSLGPLLSGKDVVAIGPGLGQDGWAKSLFAVALDAGHPLILDADALNLLAADPRSRHDWVLTPHAGEAGRLLGMTSSQVQDDRFAAVEQLASRFGGVCVLKGSGTLVQAGDSCYLCDRGTPAMAGAGMGDVLTGVIAALMGQGLPASMAAHAGVWLHAVAGEDARRGDQVSVRASDLLTPVATRLPLLMAHGPV